MTMSWLMTVQEAGTPSLMLANWPPGIEFDLAPRWISLDPGVGDEPPPNPNRFGTLQHWPGFVEIRRPDGTRVSAAQCPLSIHLNFAYKLRSERDAVGRIRSPWRQRVVLRGVSVVEVPLGSEIWGEVTKEDFQSDQFHFEQFRADCKENREIRKTRPFGQMRAKVLFFPFVIVYACIRNSVDRFTRIGKWKICTKKRARKATLRKSWRKFKQSMSRAKTGWWDWPLAQHGTSLSRRAWSA